MENQLWVILRTLMFMGAAVAAVVCGLTLVGGLVFGRPRLARGAGILLGAGGGIYCLLLLTASLVGKEATIPVGGEKYFCEIDCHLANSVVGARSAKALGTGTGARTPQGTFYVVSVKTRFDETTISSHRPKDALLYPNPRGVALVDAAGKTYEESAEGAEALASEGVHSTPLTQPLIPGESYTTELVFDLPASAVDPRLLLTEDEWPVRFVIGHENSLLHRKKYLALPAAATP